MINQCLLRYVCVPCTTCRQTLYHDRLVTILIDLAGHGERKNISFNSLVCYPSSRYMYSGSFSSIIFNIYTSSDVAYVGASSKMGSLVHSVEYHAMMALDRTMSCIWPKLSISNYHYKLSSCGNNPINKIGRNASSIYTNESCTNVSAVKQIIMHFLAHKSVFLKIP